MRSKSTFFALGIFFFVYNSAFTNTNTELITSLKFGVEYLSDNCQSNFWSNNSTYSFNRSKEQNYSAWHAFRTFEKRSPIELNFTSLNIGKESSVAIYDADKTTIIWSTDDISMMSTITKTFVNLHSDSQYYILVSSTEESQGQYKIQLNLGGSPPPINDVCSGAIDLGTLDCDYITMVYPPDSEATPDPEATGNCIDNTEPALWYTFTTPDPMPFNTLYNPQGGMVIEIFSTTSDCSDLVYEDCGICPFYFDPEPGTTYYYMGSSDFFMQIVVPGSNFTWPDCSGAYEIDNTDLEGFGSTSCHLPSSVVPCENEHVYWTTYTTSQGCEESDIILGVNDNTNLLGSAANEISITVLLDDCVTLASQFDVNGLGYVCSAMGNGEEITLENIPSGTTINIGYGSSDNNTGAFQWAMEETIEEGSLLNDICDDIEVLMEGANPNLTNECATTDVLIPNCISQSEATVWYEYDPGSIPQDISINLLSTGILSPGLAAFDDCGGSVLASSCGTLLELYCIDYSIVIEVGSSFDNTGTFDLEINSSPSLVLVPIIMGDDICSNSEADITIDIPGGELVNITIEIAPGNLPSITGMTNQSFVGVNTATISDVLVNTSSTAEEATYIIYITTLGNGCPLEPIEYTIMVYPGFTVTALSIEECLPYLLELDANEIIEGGSLPFSSIFWYWDGGLVGTTNVLSMNLAVSGGLTLEIIDSEGCTENTTINVVVSTPIVPTFNFSLSFCRSEQDYITFPETSLEGIAGTWSIPTFDLSLLNDGLYDIQFTPNQPQCSLPVGLTIDIYSGEILEFDLPDVLCSEENIYTFPIEDLNGIAGSWETPSIDFTMLSGEQTNIFTPAGEECYVPFEYVFEVSSSIDLTFGQPDTLCRTDEPFALSNISLEGHEGTWDISTIDPELISGNSITSTWTPIAGQSPCLNETTITVQITESISPEFSLPNMLCSLDGDYTFPTNDNQTINGTWSIPTINPSEITGSIQSVFTTDDFCVESFTWEIEIVEPLIPEFNLDLELCSLDDIYTLPMISDNGISGTWTEPTIDPSMNSGDQIMTEFYGDPTEFCVRSVELVFDVIEAVDPIFNLPKQVCWTDEDLLLPSTSDNGIEGIWTPSLIDIQSNLGTTLSSTFTAIDGGCSNDQVHFFEFVSPYEVEAIVTGPMDCVTDDGSILIDVIEGTNLEYSIDGGMTWQSSTLFNSLGTGEYNILVRSSDLTGCVNTIEAFLSSPDGPIVNEVQSFNISSCVDNNGQIIIEAQGNDLEYSIDLGLNWQTSNEFDNLQEGFYTISIREAMSDCVVEASANITDFPQTQIITVNSESISDCSVEDGQIEIIASGEALEYSINNGGSWSTDYIFNNLPDGVYEIIVQSTEGEDCVATMTVEITAPDMPNIINVETQNPRLCTPATGRITIEADGDNLEYSINGGASWQSSNLFLDIEPGNYHIIVRDNERLNCSGEVEISIISELENLPESSFELKSPTSCDSADGEIIITNSSMDIEYSIDGGVTWQNDNIFSNLSSGIYTIVSRKILIPECQIEQALELPSTECPCNDLTLEFNISNISCENNMNATIELVSIEGMNNANVLINWQNGQEGQIVEEVEIGWIFLTIEYDDHCIWLDSVWVDYLTSIEFELNIDDLDCPEENDGAIEVINVVGGSGIYEYSIGGSIFQLDPIFKNLSSGNYEIYVKDDGDCITAREVEVLSKGQIEISLPEIEVVTEGESIVLDPEIDESQLDGFRWTSNRGLSNTEELILEVVPGITTTYTLEIFYGDCIGTKAITIEVVKSEEIFIGNVFTPNGDNNNDFLYIQGIENSTIELIEFTIYDRWGNNIYKNEAPEFNVKEDGWDGYYIGKRVNFGVYVYVINYTKKGEYQYKVGTVTLID